MQPLTIHRGLVAPLPRRDIDTDQIIPKQFLKSLERTGFGRHLFHDWRLLADGASNPDFVLNQARYAGASILVTGANFGCGSSREHAAWALEDFGFRVVIASSFADIFRGNATKNGLLPVEVPEHLASHLADAASRTPGYTVDVDLLACELRHDGALLSRFTIDEAVRHRLLHGLDEIDVILRHESLISQFEAAHSSPRPSAAR
jgi:3-isopropylmalate/(R)-2-methylmalate dehydratase small subunit